MVKHKFKMGDRIFPYTEDAKRSAWFQEDIITIIDIRTFGYRIEYKETSLIKVGQKYTLSFEYAEANFVIYSDAVKVLYGSAEI